MKILLASFFIFFISIGANAQNLTPPPKTIKFTPFTPPKIKPDEETNAVQDGDGMQVEEPIAPVITGEPIAPVIEEPLPEIFWYVEQLPSFPGGENEMYKFLGNNIVYPEYSKEANIQGKVFLQFVVRADGEITDIKILRGVSPEIDAEAIRVLKLMPKWIPGKQNGRNVSVYFKLPINFALE